KIFWQKGRQVLVDRGVPYSQAGSLLGKLLKAYGEDPTVPLEKIETIEQQNIADPRSWLGACLKSENLNHLPRDDEKLEAWALQHELPPPAPGLSYPEYRELLKAEIQRRRKAA
ncbi:MAG: hypothetical protein AAGA95_10545, partial [Pseudomonadota bacterium]